MNVLALDLGSSSVRGLVLDHPAAPLPRALARRVVLADRRDDDLGTIDVLDYLAAAAGCLDELSSAGHLDGVEVVATSSQWHSVIPLDAASAPIGPAVTWRNKKPAPLPGSRGPADDHAFHQRTGAWWHRLYWTVRLPWLRSRSGSSPVRFLGLAEYLLGVLLDEAPMSVSQASGTGMLDLRTLDWDPEACEIAGVGPDKLPPLAPADWRGRLRADYARRWPALRDAWWAPPIGDGAAANIGSWCADPSRVAITVGTSAAVRQVQLAPPDAPLPPLSERLWRYRVDRDRVITGVGFSAGGNLYGWARRELRLPEGAGLEEALERVPAGGGVRADPCFGGDRPPGVAPPGSGRLEGLGFATTSVEIFAGLMAGVCRQLAAGLDEIESTLVRPAQVVLGGGAVAASAWWRRSFAAALAPREVYYVRNPEVAAVGAALVALGLPNPCSVFELIPPPTEDG